jgi:hypothetical protein
MLLQVWSVVGVGRVEMNELALHTVTALQLRSVVNVAAMVSYSELSVHWVRAVQTASLLCVGIVV